MSNIIHRTESRSLFLVAVALAITYVIFPALVPSVLAQTGTASLSGRVTDQQNAVIPDVEIEIKDVDKNLAKVTRTNGEGIYSFPALQPGNYIMSVRKQQFQTVSVTGISLHTQDSLARNFVLQVGSSAESITINAYAEHMPTDNTGVGVLVNRDFIENMPLNGRSFQDLIALAPGAVTANDGTGLFNINGQRSDANYFTVDGVAANTYAGNPGTTQVFQALSGSLPGQTVLGTTQPLASIDSVQEFKIQTAGYSAEFGRQPGGQIELTTRSGSNDVHGSLFEYFRNDAMDANNWFFDQLGIPKQPERQNDFGGTVGGPLIIPKVYDGKGRTFYFVSYEGLRLEEPQFSGIADVPTPAFRQFAAAAVKPFLDSAPLPNVVGNLTNGDQCAAILDPNYPNLPPNSPFGFSCTGEWASALRNPSSLDSLSVRIDQTVGQRVQVFARYADSPSDTSNYNQSTLQSDRTKTYSWTAGVTVKASTDLLNEFRFNYGSSSFRVDGHPVMFEGAVPYPRDLVLPSQYAPANAGGGSNLIMSIPTANFFTLARYTYSATSQNQYNIVESTSWTHNSHLLKFGVDFRRLAPAFNNLQYGTALEFLSAASVQQGSADFGAVNAGHKAVPIFHNLSLYMQDHWKLSTQLTIDYGLRWEFNPPAGAADGIYPLALTTANLATAQIAPQGTPQYHSVYHDFAPRAGFAYQVNRSPAHLLVVRGGFGVFYDTGQALAAAGYSSFPFFGFTLSSDVPLPAPASFFTPPSLNVPIVPPYPTISNIMDPHLALPYAEQWNFSTDLGLFAKNTATLSYVGNAGKKLLFRQNYSDLSNVNPDFTSLQFTSNAASSSYNGLQIQDQGYIKSDLQVLASYTFAHAIDNASSDYGNLYLLRGNSDNDVRHVFNFAVNYRLSKRTSTGIFQSLAGGWSFDGRFSAQSGYPIPVNQNTLTLLDGSNGYIIPDLVPGVPVYLHNAKGVLGGWALNPAAFSPAPTDPNTGAPLRQGTLGRNRIYGPNFWNLNFGLQRSFPLYEGLDLKFRAEAFNIFNHPNAGGIDPCLCDSTFGASNAVGTTGVPDPLYATGAARSLQLMLKLEF